ncbi:hypothetical protein GH714_039620 [Hevea brasiliensis]|uniref:SAUR family protein n=1 Tax=Hevea brasiliensis TaxID=3981 RepID=A0A6A6MYP8_HEVBR|nr:hypothetical protein GH714_039620 [Hevea brasiliensis]
MNSKSNLSNSEQEMSDSRDNLKVNMSKGPKKSFKHNRNLEISTSSAGSGIKEREGSVGRAPNQIASSNDAVPKGFLAVCVGKELKRYVIPTEYLGHQAFGILLREAEEEFGFQQEGVLKIPCQVSVFEKILKVVEEKSDVYLLHELGFNNIEISSCWSSSDYELTPSHHPQMCR